MHTNHNRFFTSMLLLLAGLACYVVGLSQLSQLAQAGMEGLFGPGVLFGLLMVGMVLTAAACWKTLNLLVPALRLTSRRPHAH